MARETRYKLYQTNITDATFNNIWAFKTKTERTTWLNTKIKKQYPNMMYWRVGNPIKIPESYEDSFKYDYVIITNKYGTNKAKEYYCFIIGRSYINENCTVLQLAVDYIQTYYFEGEQPFWKVQGHINRETTKGDYIPSRGIPSDYPVPAVANYAVVNPVGDYYYIVYSTIDLEQFINEPSVSPSYRTAVIDGVVMAAAPYIIGTYQKLNSVVYYLNQQGYTAAVSSVYCLSKEFCQAVPDGVYKAESYVTKTKQVVIEAPTNCAGYTPVNKSLLTHDYTNIIISNFQGETQQWRFEDFTGNPMFILEASLTAGYPVLECYPINYKYGNVIDHSIMAQKCTSPVQCTYLNDNYRIWLAQTQNSRAAAIDGANLAISQAKEARANSFSYQMYKQGSGVIRDASQAVGTAVGSLVAAFSGGG